MVFSRKITSITTWMVYAGTICLSLLSYFTTYQGLSIMIDKPLAIVGSLGLQIAMLGIAWNLMSLKENRVAYMAVFSMAAMFSIFFSYVNFDHELNKDTRINNIRKNYNLAATPMMTEYSLLASEAAMKGRYQLERLNDILEMEKKNGWGTFIDEGSGDTFIQSVIDGARKTSASWKKRVGKEYHQGRGQGIISNFLQSRVNQSRENLMRVTRYVSEMEKLSLKLNSGLSVGEQHLIVNKAWVDFPIHEIALLTSKEVKVQNPPSRASYIEKAETRQQAFLMVINDLIAGDKLAIFALLLAFTIDFMIVLTAFAGSYIVNDEDYLYEKIKLDSVKRLQNLSLDDSEALASLLDGNLDKYRQASKYSSDIKSVLSGEREESNQGRKITLTRTEEKGKIQ